MILCSNNRIPCLLSDECADEERYNFHGAEEKDEEEKVDHVGDENGGDVVGDLVKQTTDVVGVGLI